MLTNEIPAGLEQWSARAADARRRVREAGPAEKATRIRYAGQCRREAFKYLALACGSLRMWPGREQVGEPGVRVADRGGSQPDCRPRLPERGTTTAPGIGKWAASSFLTVRQISRAAIQ
ncbi:hypothetical protein [Streptomyces niveus]